MSSRRAQPWWPVAAGLAVAIGLPDQAKADDLYVRVVDVGNALCVVVKEPLGGVLLYDAGNFSGGQCLKGLQDVVGQGRIDLIALSHSDSDHIGELDKILAAYPGRVEQVVYTGREGNPVQTWFDVEAALFARETRPARIRALGPIALPAWYTDEDRGRVTMAPLPNVADPQAQPWAIDIGAMRVTFVAGWIDWPEVEPTEGSERSNIVSLVVRIDYAGKSILLTGDTIGRMRGDPADTCIGAERWMVDHAAGLIDSDVLIGQHHGGDNSSAICFLETVSPRYAVLAAGHVTHIHPRLSAVRRFTGDGIAGARMIVPGGRIFQTDRGDDQGALEWSPQSRPGCSDRAGDDDVEVFVSNDPSRDIRVRYRIPTDGPCGRALARRRR